MTQVARLYIDRVARRAADQWPKLKKRPQSSLSIRKIVSVLFAEFESSRYQEKLFSATPSFASSFDLLSVAVSMAIPGGLFLEFGVATGGTIRHLAPRADSTIYGFDSFEGLPEDWREGFEKGRFATPLPDVPANVSLVKGWYSDTLPEFLSTHQDKVSFLHIDCDLYSSTKCIFDLLGDRIQPGTVIQFDEYWNYPGWKQHEFKAFEELKASRKLSCRPIGFVPSNQQVAFVITSAF